MALGTCVLYNSSENILNTPFKGFLLYLKKFSFSNELLSYFLMKCKFGSKCMLSSYSCEEIVKQWCPCLLNVYPRLYIFNNKTMGSNAGWNIGWPREI